MQARREKHLSELISFKDFIFCVMYSSALMEKLLWKNGKNYCDACKCVWKLKFYSGDQIHLKNDDKTEWKF